MMKRREWLQLGQAAVVMSVFNVSRTAIASERLRFTVGDFPPYFKESLPDKGVIAAVVKAAMAAAGVEVEFVFLPWARALEYAKQGTSAGSPGWTSTPEREVDFLFSKPFVNCQDGVFYLKENPIAYSSVADFRGRRIGVVNGLTYGKEFADAQSRQEFQTEIAPASENLMQMLLRGRTDAIIVNQSVGAQLLSTMPKEETSRIEMSTTPFLLKPWRLAVGKKNPDAQKIIAMFDEGLLRIQRNGTYRRLMSDPAYGLLSQMVRF